MGRRFIGALTLLAGLLASFVGILSVALFWTPYAGWVIPLAAVALGVGNTALLVDRLRDTEKFTVSVTGTTLGTIAIALAFVHQGGLQFERYKPVIVTRVETKEVIREVPTEADTVPVVALAVARVPVTRATIGNADEKFKVAASHVGQRELVAAGMIISHRDNDHLSWQFIEKNMIDFQFGEIRNQFHQWKADRIAAGDQYE
jgi:hypothetical protein